MSRQLMLGVGAVVIVNFSSNWMGDSRAGNTPSRRISAFQWGASFALLRHTCANSLNTHDGMGFSWVALIRLRPPTNLNTPMPRGSRQALKSGVRALVSELGTWVQSFGHEGLGLLLDILEKLLYKKEQEKLDKKNQHKVIQCLKAFMNNKYGLDRILAEEKSLALLARAIDPTQSAMMTDVMKLLSAICIVGEENTLEKVLEAITTAGEWRAIERFSPIAQGLRDRSVQLQVACMQLINALVTSPDELDFRLHIRNEFMRCGLKEILPQLTAIRNDALDIQLKVFVEHKEEDMMEFSHRLEDIKSELEYPCYLEAA
ncbi:unnamed protein product [Pleuronectes platessa]|uniref:GBD/FH3 domain-containing protein n=1 Tax=Pleuronectes platessa TaxID=8262 RepID=A0A9N7UV09_PLEPL|nr:unnamed protein product [Pleuronectes platessa]